MNTMKLLRLLGWCAGIFLFGQCVTGGFSFAASFRALGQSGAVLEQAGQVLQRNQQVAQSLDGLLRELGERAKAGDSAAKKVLESCGFRLEGDAKPGVKPIPLR